MKKILSVLLFMLSGNAWSYGEIFRLSTTGTQYCSGYKPVHFTPSNSYPFFVRFDDDVSIPVFVGSIKDTPDFVADLDAAFINTNRVSFDAFYYQDNGNHMEAVGTIKLDKYGVPKTLKATFMRKGLTDDCYSVGKMAGKRVY